MYKYNLDILGVSECRWTGSGSTKAKGHSTILFSGRENSHTSGVTIIISKARNNSLLEWEPISDRLITARFNYSHCKLSIIQCYATTNDADEDDKDTCYEQQSTIAKIPQHYIILVMPKLDLSTQMQAAASKQIRQRLNIHQLKSPVVKNQFILEIQNRFSALEDLDQQDVKSNWDNIKNTYVETGKKVLGVKASKSKEWLCPHTWKLIDERKEIKNKLLNTKSQRLLDQLNELYRNENKQVKKSARNDRRNFLNQKAARAEQAAQRGDLSAVYKITKELRKSNANQSIPVKDKDGKTISSEHGQAEIWV
ncbi:uncharacterized protein LOC144356268 [Saccoglossus kowalevskii]